jgi:hypothetical protein
VNKERMGKFEGGEERLKKYCLPILEIDKKRYYIYSLL